MILHNLKIRQDLISHKKLADFLLKLINNLYKAQSAKVSKYERERKFMSQNRQRLHETYGIFDDDDDYDEVVHFHVNLLPFNFLLI